jgi:hypothetical protein
MCTRNPGVHIIDVANHNSIGASGLCKPYVILPNLVVVHVCIIHLQSIPTVLPHPLRLRLCYIVNEIAMILGLHARHMEANLASNVLFCKPLRTVL